MRKGTWFLGLSLVLTCAAAAAAQAQAPSFRSSVGDQILGTAGSLTVEDLDGDGNRDLLVPISGDSGSSGAVSILYGFGDTSFDGQIDAVTNSAPTAVAVGDFNKDGHKDLATVDPNSLAVSVLLGTDAKDIFDGPVVTLPKTCSTAGTACEIDDNCPEGQTCVLRGVTSARDVVAAFLDDDDKLDLAIVSDDSAGQLAVLFGLGDGTFIGSSQSPYATGSTTRAVKAIDLNHDGKIDLVAANLDSASISVLINNGGGQFLAPTSDPAGESPVDIAVGKFDEDDNVDVVVANYNTNSFSLLRGDGQGGFGPPSGFAAGMFPSAVDVADFDGDGHLDVVVANSLSYDVTVAFGDGQGSFSRLRSYLGGTKPIDVATGRIDGDERPDIVVLAVIGSSNYSILLSEDDRSFHAPETFRTASNAGQAAVGDVDGDGLPDAVVTSSSEPVLTLLRATSGSTLQSSSIELSQSATAALLADLDRDGQPELLIAGGEDGGGFVGVARRRGSGGFDAPVLTTVGRGPSALTVGDFNEDGRLDVAVAEGTENAMSVLLTQEDGTLGAPTRIILQPLGEDISYQPRAIAAVDLDLDGHVDVVVANFREEGKLSLVYGKGNGTFEMPVNHDAGRRPLAIEVSDVDNDGRPDLLTANENDNGGLVLLHATGTRTYDAPKTMSVSGQAEGLALRDVTGDGIRDAIAAVFNAERLVIRPGGATTGPFFRATVNSCPQPNCFEPGFYPGVVVAGDFDDNGTYDLISVNAWQARNATLVLSDLSSALVRSDSTTVPRGDGNGDGRVEAADLVAVMSLLGPYNRAAVEDLRRSGRLCGSTPAAPCEGATMALDADGDGLLSTVDSTAVAARIFR